MTRLGLLLRRPIWVVAVAALLLAPAVVWAPPSEAQTALILEGRGYGHGIGMSQHGAQSRAVAGHAYPQILAAYYPGTVLATATDARPIRVRIESDTDSQTTVAAENGLRIVNDSLDRPLPATVAGGAPSQWRLRPTATGLALEAFVSGVWRAIDDAGLTSLLASSLTADLVAADGSVRLLLGSTLREYSGGVRAVRLTASQSRTVVVTTLGSYLPSVVTSEMPSSWAREALRAQSVAARTYARFDQASKSATSYYDTCDTTACQVFNGNADYRLNGSLIRSWTAPTTVAAVADTNGKYLSYGGAPAFTQFSASNGGFSVAGTRPYLVAAPDPYDPGLPWGAQISLATISGAYPHIGTFRRFELSRDGRGPYGGRVTAITLTGTAGSQQLTGSAFRTAFGLRSTLVDVALPSIASPQRDVTGDGRPDLLATNDLGQLFRWDGRGGGLFGARTQIGHGWGVMGPMTLAHNLSGGSRTELISIQVSTGQLWSYAATSPGTLMSRRLIGTRGWSAMDNLIAVHGWARPGETGLLARHATTGLLFYYAATGNGGLKPARQVGNGWGTMSHIIAAGDWDRDSRPDLIAVNDAGQMWLYPGTGDGGFAARVQIGQGWSSMTGILGSTDWDGDGVLDLVAQGPDGSLRLYPGDGNAGFERPRQIGSGWAAFELVH